MQLSEMHGVETVKVEGNRGITIYYITKSAKVHLN